MASNIKITDVLIGDNTGKAGLVIENGAEKFVLSGHGLCTFSDNKLVAAEAVTGAKAETIVEDALNQIVSKPEALPEKVRGNLNKIVPTFKSPDTLAVFKDGVDFAPRLAKLDGHVAVLDALAAGDKAALETALNASPTTMKLLGKDQLEAAGKLVDTKAIGEVAELASKEAAALAKTAAEAATSKAGLLELFKKNAKPAEIDAYLDKNLAHLEELITVESPKNINLKGAIGHKLGEITTAKSEAQTLADNFARLSREASAAETLGDIEAAKPLREGAEAAKKKLTTLVDGKYGSFVKKELSADTLTRIKGHDAGLAKTLGAESAEVSKKGFRIFTKASEDLTHFNEGQLKGIKGLWNKRTITGKAALVGVPVVAVAYLAGIGSKGKHTDQVMDQKIAGLDQAAGVA